MSTTIMQTNTSTTRRYDSEKDSKDVHHTDDGYNVKDGDIVHDTDDHDMDHLSLLQCLF